MNPSSPPIIIASVALITAAVAIVLYGSKQQEHAATAAFRARMNCICIFRSLFCCMAVSITACSEKSAPARVEKQNRPNDVQNSLAAKPDDARANLEVNSEPAADEVALDCVAFVRSTMAARTNGENGNCPDCPGAGASKEVLRFQSLQIDEVTSMGPTCEVGVTLHAIFNPSSGGETIRGGLTGWIPADQKAEYLAGQTPTGQQAYKVKITYKRDGRDWRAVEFAVR